MLTYSDAAIRYIGLKEITMATMINGMPTKPVPASVTRAMAKGTPKRTALSGGPKPVSTVRV